MIADGKRDDDEQARAERAARIHERIEELTKGGEADAEPSSPRDAADRAAIEAAERARRAKRMRAADDTDDASEAGEQSEEAEDGGLDGERLDDTGKPPTRPRPAVQPRGEPGPE
jgi:hypothetical protein